MTYISIGKNILYYLIQKYIMYFIRALFLFFLYHWKKDEYKEEKYCICSKFWYVAGR